MNTQQLPKGHSARPKSSQLYTWPRSFSLLPYFSFSAKDAVPQAPSKAPAVLRVLQVSVHLPLAGGAGPPRPAEVLARQDTLSGPTRAPLYGPLLCNPPSSPTLLQHLVSTWLLHKDEGGLYAGLMEVFYSPLCDDFKGVILQHQDQTAPEALKTSLGLAGCETTVLHEAKPAPSTPQLAALTAASLTHKILTTLAKHRQVSSSQPTSPLLPAKHISHPAEGALNHKHIYFAGI